MPTWQDRLIRALTYFFITAQLYLVTYQYYYEFEKAPDPVYHFGMIVLLPTVLRLAVWLAEPYRNPVIAAVIDYVIVVVLVYNFGQFYWAVVTCASLHLIYLFVGGWTLQEGPYSKISSLLRRSAR